MKHKLLLLLSVFSMGAAMATEIFVEAESFEQKGGWVVDQQFMDVMGSPYMMAHGLGIPVEDAETTVEFPATNTYYISLLSD